MFDYFLKVIGYVSLSRRHKWWGRPLTLIFFLLISSSFVLSLIRLVLFREKIVVSSVFFYLVSPVQYILGVRYMMGTHFQSVLRDCRRSLIKMPSESKIFSFIIGITILSLINLIIMITQSEQKVPKGFGMVLDTMNHTSIGVNDTMIVVVDQTGVNGVYAWLFMFWIASAITQATNLVLFALVFHKHLKDIANLKNHLESDIIWRMNQESFIDLTRQIIGLRYGINQSVDNLENFYTTFTILGAIAIGPVLESKEATPYAIYYCVLYVLTQSLFVYYIYFISKNREDILKIIKSPLVMFKYLTNVNNVHRVDEILKQEMAELKKLNPENVHTLNKYKIAAYSPRNFGQSTLDQMEKGLMEKKALLEEDGFELRKMSSPRPIMRSRKSSSRSSSRTRFPTRPSEHKRMSKIKTSKSDPQDLRIDMMKIRQAEKKKQEEEEMRKEGGDLGANELKVFEKLESEILTMSYKNNAAIYWMILHQVLEEKWASFSLMGMSFDDTDVIQKSMGMTSAIIFASTYLNSLSLV